MLRVDLETVVVEYCIEYLLNIQDWCVATIFCPSAAIWIICVLQTLFFNIHWPHSFFWRWVSYMRWVYALSIIYIYLRWYLREECNSCVVLENAFWGAALRSCRFWRDCVVGDCLHEAGIYTGMLLMVYNIYWCASWSLHLFCAWPTWRRLRGGDRRVAWDWRLR